MESAPGLQRSSEQEKENENLGQMEAASSSSIQVVPPLDGMPGHTIALCSGVPGSVGGNGSIRIHVDFMVFSVAEKFDMILHPRHSIYDLKVFIQKEKGKGACILEELVVYHDGTRLKNATRLGDIFFGNTAAVLVTLAKDPTANCLGLGLPLCDLVIEEPIQNSCLPPLQAAREPVVSYGLGALPNSSLMSNSNSNLSDFGGAFTLPNLTSLFDYPFDNTSFCDPAPDLLNEPQTNGAATPRMHDIVDNAGTSTHQTTGCPPSVAAEATPNNSPAMAGGLLTPLTFSDQVLAEIDTHGFRSAYELRSKINKGPARWISKKEAFALLSNADIFSVGVTQEEDKRDGLVCVIDSNRCVLPDKLTGYRVKANEESSENYIGKIKVKGVEMDWHEVRGKLWARRRLVYNNSILHVVQWKQLPTSSTEKTKAIPVVAPVHEDEVIKQIHTEIKDIHELVTSLKQTTEDGLMALGQRVSTLERVVQHLTTSSSSVSQAAPDATE